MSDDPVISVQNVSKAYRIWNDPAQRLISPLLAEAGQWLPGGAGLALRRRAAGGYRDFFALREVSFAVKRGEAVGIIGRNGSGKSTLLQIIAGTLQPTEGKVKVNGRVAALLELGSGFNPEFTGRENVHLNAAVLGLSRREIDARFDGIAAFADIGDFMDQPVKTHSSGMLMRLAFAVQTAVEPDVLIVDEALSVGDFFFQQKCATRMRTLREQGTTVLFVSHDLASVRDLCQRTVYLRHGRAEFWGETQAAIARYFNEDQASATAAPADATGAQAGLDSFELPNAFWRREQTPAREPTAAEWLAVDFQDEHSVSTTRFRMTSRLRLKAVFRARERGHYRAALELKNRHDHLVNSTSCHTAGVAAVLLAAGETCLFEVLMTLNFEAGRYSCQLVLAADDLRPNRGTRLDVTPWLGPLDIDWNYEQDRAPFLGMFGPPVSVSFITSSTP